MYFIASKSHDSFLTDKCVQACANLLANMHAHVASAGFQPPAEKRRADWSDDLVLKTALADTSPETALFSTELHKQVQWMRQLPRSRSNFGLTHAGESQIAN